MGAGFGVGQGVVVQIEVEAAVGCDGGQPVVGEQAAQFALRGPHGAVERVVGVIQVVGPVGGDEAAAIEGGVVCHEWQVAHQWLELLPNFVESGSVTGVVGGDVVYCNVVVEVVVGVGLDEAVPLIHYLPVPDEYQPHAAHARPQPVGRFKIYCYKIVHYETCSDVIVVKIEMASSTLSTSSMSNDRLPLMSRMWHRRGFSCR